jgi:glucose/arabinose dehydrogenase
MKLRSREQRTAAFCVAWFLFSIPAISQPGRIELQPLLAAGLEQPVLLTHAGDATGRRFLVEQPGRILLLQPNSDSPSTFLDITERVRSGGEQGLLGLAFHPQFSANGRFFVSYTRSPDGASIIAEYGVLPGERDMADSSERILLTVAQPFGNHNGGMIQFGPDGFLYIGLGDGGSGNDPGNRAQDISDLLGKILRIDVDRKDPGMEYAIPADNPFSGNPAGRDEIYALGLRNPWRFSFDRLTGRLWAGDVGQGAIEEIDLISLGGNYGWRIFEGTRCTNLGPASCSSDSLVPPVAEYDHSLGRCSVTGGYVYRGKRQTLPYGSYVFGDFCSGEVFLLTAGLTEVLIDTNLLISSFGEDEAGEIYVLDHAGGGVAKIVNPQAPELPTFHFPRFSTGNKDPFGGEDYVGLAVSDVGANGPQLAFDAFEISGGLILDQDITNPAMIQMVPGNQLARLAGEIFGSGISVKPRIGWIRMRSSFADVAPFFLSFNSSLTVMDGAPATALPLPVAVLPEIEEGGFTQIHVGNPHPESINIRLELMSSAGTSKASVLKSVAGLGLFLGTADEVFTENPISPSDYIRVTASPSAVSYQHLGIEGRHVRGLNGLDGTAGAALLYSPQYVVGGGYATTIGIVNLEANAGEVELRFWRDDGTQIGKTISLNISAHGKIVISDPGSFGDFPSLTQGYVEIRSSGPRLAGSVSYHDENRLEFSTALPLVSSLQRKLTLSQVASNDTYYTGLVIVNPLDEAVAVVIEVYDSTGILQGSLKDSIPARARLSGVLTELFLSFVGMDISGGYASISADREVAAFGVFGTHTMSILSAIPAGVGP